MSFKQMKDGTFFVRQDVRELRDRVEALEAKVNKTSRKEITTRGQQILLMHHLGLLDALEKFKFSNVKKAKLLSLILNAGVENLRRDLSELHKSDSELLHETNYKFLLDIFSELQLEELVVIAEKKIVEIENKKYS